MSVTLLAMRGMMGDNEYYVATVKANTLIQTVGYASEMEKWPDMTVDERMQRELKGERIATEIVPYLVNDPDWFFGALIIDIYSGWENVVFQPISEVAEVKYAAYQETLNTAGFLTLPDDKSLIALDGQHRLAALSMAIRGKNGIPGSVTLPENIKNTLEGGHPDIGKADITVMFIKHGEDNTKIRKIFNKVNRYAKQTSKGDNIITSEDDMIAIIARRMFSGEDAPLHPIGNQDVVNWKSNTIPLRSKNLTTLSAIYTMTEILLARKGITPKTRKDDELLEEGRILMRDFWNELMDGISIFRTYREYVEKDMSLATLRKQNLLLKPVTHTALAQAVSIAMDHGYQYEDLIAKINKINWSQDNPVWSNILVTNSMNKRMITGSQALKNAGKIIAYMIAGNKFSAKDVAEVREILKDANANIKGENEDEPAEIRLPEIIGEG
jgi:DNA sulfur modification protein DndB